MACHNGHQDVVQTLLGAGADVNIATSDVSYVMFYNGTHDIIVLICYPRNVNYYPK